MHRTNKILCVVGTRPEAIKMAPVILALQRHTEFSVRILATAQHRSMLDQVLEMFQIQPDIDLNVMRDNQRLPDLTARLITAMDGVLTDEQPAAVLAQGDTTTAMVTALVSFYQRIPFGHVEAGLRTGDLSYPFPEEMNRVVAGRLAHWHFAPTDTARRNLLAEGIGAGKIFVTGNTVIDALLDVAKRCNDQAPAVRSGARLVLVTAHRRENFGEPFAAICRAIRYLADTRDDVEFLYPVHPNPNISNVATTLLANHPRIRLCEPLDYVPFVAAMKTAHFILSDSGGVQEEAPALGKPVLVLRRETERPEAVEQGVVKLVGPDFAAIVRESLQLLDNEQAYRSMSRGVSPYGDGHAAPRIAEILMKELTAREEP
ncbi:UDP-N-acetylglucosamine 2-epimerase (non-hydrolyzing) [Nitrospira sp.]|nr:UDP-N-acetylglucosamine 2-epimerase (non-hydrolyzing) [Nitrospira sp.]